MSKIVINKEDNLYLLSEIIKNSEDSEITFVIGGDIPFMQNEISLKFLEKSAEAADKKVSFENPESSPINIPAANMVQDTTPSEFTEGDRKRVGRSYPFKKVFVFIFIILLFGGGFSLAWWYIPNASINIQLNTETLVKNVELTASINEQKVNINDKKIPAVLLEAVRKSSDSIQTTGKKEVGEKASGTVKIYNKTNDKQTFGAGTEIILISAESESLSFFLNETVTVEEKKETTTETGVTITFGIVKANVTAENYGEKYNVPENEKFEIENTNTADFLAQNEAAFSGGSSKTVPAVTEEDKKVLRDKLESQLRELVKQDIELKIVGDQKLAENSVSYEIIEETYDKKVGEEANQLNLNMQIRTYALAYYQKDMEELVKSVLERSVPEQYLVSDTETKFEIGNAIADKPTPPTKDEIALLVKVKSYVVPKISEEEIKDNILGKSIHESEDYLNSLNNISSFKLTIWPALPSFLKTAPHLKSRIYVEIENQ